MTPPQSNEERPIAALLAPDILALLDELPATVAVETEEMHPADLADVAEAMPRERVRVFLDALPRERAAEVMMHLSEELRTEVLEAMSARDAAALVVEMTPDDRADVLEELEEDVADDILDEMPAEEREETEQLAAYDPYTAGGLMTTEYVKAPEDLTSEAALRGVRRIARSGRREAMHAIYVTNPDGALSGVLSLRELLAAPEGARMSDIAHSEVQSVRASASQEDVARMIGKYDLVAVPVVDEQGQILGVVTVDDVIDVIQEEATEDVQKLGGMEALDEPYMQISLGRMLRKRAGWLCALFVGELFTATVMQHYESELRRAAVLILFIPLIVSAGGNSGSQATSLIIRAMALSEVRLRDWWKVARRELPTGLMLGAVLGVIGIFRVLAWEWLGLWRHQPHYGLVAITVGLAVLGVVTFGSLAGSMLPFLLRRIGFDPASASAPFVATLVDVTGLAIYFTVALLILGGTLL
jgi:magnesium transporter